MKRYLVNEIFYSIQGEGARAGVAHVFVRFAKCNLHCNIAEHGFDCDTNFEHGHWYEREELIDAVRAQSQGCRWVLFTGGEPALQLDGGIVADLKRRGWMVAIETNGTQALPAGIDWICVSPKTDVVVRTAHEVKCVVGHGQEPDGRGIRARHRLVSPAFKGDEPDPDAMEWCYRWVLDHPDWRLSLQTHKWLGVR